MLVIDSLDALTRGPITAYRAMDSLHIIAQAMDVTVL
jgi:hypothetical protein